jgi:hypothetical protein
VVNVKYETFSEHKEVPDADDVNLLGDHLDTTKKNTETLIDNSQEASMDVNTEN